MRYAVAEVVCASVSRFCSSAGWPFASAFASGSWRLRMGSTTRHHHLTSPRSSKICLRGFSTLPGKRYWFCARAKRERTSLMPGL
ncbi:hypothetical protein ACKS0A_03640 [Histoplasma ohiense]